MPPHLRRVILGLSGALLCALGVLHLAVTPFIARMVQDGAAPSAVDWLTPPMLLNHVVVGVLLLPLGGLTYYAAPHAASGSRWALVTVRSIAVAMATLPPILFSLMGTRYFGAVPFRIAAGIVTVASLTLLLVAFWPASAARPANEADSAA
ncbi:MAG: hypothetical protein EXS08_13505 [Planctomycetes bacterium]|nr:hypothetical protein [Planctomycetota bacterium]